MSRIPVAALLALSALAFPTSPVLAQVFVRPPPPASPQSRVGGVNDRNDVQLCAAAPGGSRVRPNCEEPETTTLRVTQELKLSIELAGDPEPAMRGHDHDRVPATRHLRARRWRDRDLGLHGGRRSLHVAVRVKGESGEEKVLEFSETWQRSDDRDVIFAADYPIGEDVELVNVRVRSLTCTCADPPEVQDSAANPCTGGFSP